MQSLGIDLGSSSVKLVLLENGNVTAKWLSVHHGRPFDALRRGLTALPFQLSLDNDWDEAAWSRLRSFLYYC